MVDAYIKIRDALRSTGRPIVYSLCQYGNDVVWEWDASVGGNLWRTTGDISDHLERSLGECKPSIICSKMVSAQSQLSGDSGLPLPQ
jgi:hypothetical protein